MKYKKALILGLLLAILFGYLFLGLLSSHMLLEKEDGLYSGGSTWGDLALHLTLINNFAQQGLRLDKNPLFYGTTLSYSFVIDYISALLIKFGLSLRNALILPSFIFAMASIVLIYALALKMTKSAIAAFLAPFMFLLNGSIASLYYFWKDFRQSEASLIEFLNNMRVEYAHLENFKISFSNIIADYVLPQRTFILGLVVGIVAVLFLWQYWIKEDKKNLLYAGISISLLPWVHIHSFVTLIIACAFLALIQFYKNPQYIKKIISDWLWFAIPIIFIALPQFLLIYPKDRGSFIRPHIGWMSNGMPIALFWLKNLTPHLIIFAIAYAVSNKKLRAFYLAFLGVFIISNLILFQPHIYDNMKIMLWWFLLSIVLASNLFAYLIKKWKLKSAFIILPIFISMIITGALSLYRESYVSWRMFSNEDVEMAEFIKQNTRPNALFLTTDQHNNPIPTLAGRNIVMGYRGWLWTYGIDYKDREQDVFSIYSGSPNAKGLISKYGISYVAIDKNRIKDFHINEAYYRKNYSLIYKNSDFLIYKTKI